jgi:hypothetical protein
MISKLVGYAPNGANCHQAKLKVPEPPQPFSLWSISAIIIFQDAEVSEHHRRLHI